MVISKSMKNVIFIYQYTKHYTCFLLWTEETEA